MEAGEPLEAACVACERCPDVVEWCPAPWGADMLAVGTYELDEDSGERRGALIVASAAAAPPAGSAPHAPAVTWRNMGVVPLPGVYDLAWGPALEEAGCSSTLLAAACADGTLRVFHVRPGALAEAPADAATSDRCSPASSPCHVLSGAILTHAAWGAGGRCGLAVVGQDGSVSHLLQREGGMVEVLARRAAHEMEAWSVEVAPESPHLVLSGADDARLLGWDLREPPDGAPALENGRSHEAGITALACDPLRPHLLATGSYDERVRIFDLRVAGAKAPLAESEKLGDGAYHIAWHPQWPGALAVAAMRSGLPLLLVDAPAGVIREWGRYAAGADDGQHGSLAYGVCWRLSPLASARDAAPGGTADEADGGRGERWLAASASFYDRSVHVWSACPPPQLAA